MKTIALLAVLATGAFSASASGTNQAHRCCCAAKEEAATAPLALSDKSLFQLDSTWTNDFGSSVKLASLQGRPQVIVMFFANCAYACPLLVYQMQQIEAALPEALRKNVGFTLVSFDPERDTPAALHKYRAQHELKDNWTLLRGSSDDVFELAALLNVKFKKDAQGQFEHSNVITLLNPDGEIAFQQIGLNVDRGEITRRAAALAEPTTGPRLLAHGSR